MLQFLVLLAIASQATASSNRTAPATKTIVDLALATPSLSTLVTALQTGGLVKTLQGPGPYTVFAPTNAAFSALPKGVLANLLKPANKAGLDDVLTYHVLGDEVHSNKFLDGEMLRTLEQKYVTVRIAGKDILINSAKVTTADVQASNGVIHIIDAVLLPSSAPPSPGPSPSPVPGTQTIVQLAQATPNLSTLVTALGAASLVETLQGPGPFTVFAPTNAAFSALPKRVLANLLKPANKAKLVDLLTFHVVAGDIQAKDILDGERIKTVEGMYLMASVNSSGVFLNNAKVITPNVNASNGVVHIINEVLQEWNPSPSPGPSPGNHLWFRGFKVVAKGQYTCAEVDAATRMPAAIFDPSNAAKLKAYEDLTIALYGDYAYGFKLDLHLELGRCADKGYTKPTLYPFKLPWAPKQLMSAICSKQCKCNFPDCPDQPDDPSAGTWCSLCGPKFNAPIVLKVYQCANGRCAGPDDTGKNTTSAAEKWLQVLKDLLTKG